MATSSSSLPDMPYSVTVDPGARPLLVSGMARLRDGILKLIREQATASGMPVEKVHISLKHSPEDDWEEVVFWVYVDTDADNAMHFWKLLAQSMMDWRPKLSRRAQRLLDENVGVFVEW